MRKQLVNEKTTLRRQVEISGQGGVWEKKMYILIYIETVAIYLTYLVCNYDAVLRCGCLILKNQHPKETQLVFNFIHFYSQFKFCMYNLGMSLPVMQLWGKQF